jgi:hypothetical protein
VRRRNVVDARRATGAVLVREPQPEVEGTTGVAGACSDSPAVAPTEVTE